MGCGTLVRVFTPQTEYVLPDPVLDIHCKYEEFEGVSIRDRLNYSYTLEADYVDCLIQVDTFNQWLEEAREKYKDK